MRFIYSALRWVFGVVGVLLMAALLYMSFAMPHYDIISGSMEPQMSVGTVVYLHAQDAYHKNDIVTIKDGTDVFTHVLVQVKPNGEIVTRGLANPANDLDRSQATGKPLTTSNIVGKVVLSPRQGRLLVFVSFILAALLMVVWYVMKPSRKRDDHLELLHA